MPNDLPNPLTVLVMMDGNVNLDPIREAVPGHTIEVHQVPPAAFEDDAGMFPSPHGLRSFRVPWHTDLTPDERENLLRRAHAMLIALPYPLHLRDRMPNLRWVEFTYAGISDFSHSDLWNTDVAITSGRGMVEALPIAEMVIAQALAFAKQVPLAIAQTGAGKLDAEPYRLKLIAGKTMGIVGLGGIGSEVARLAKALGMRVVATRRSATSVQRNVDGIDVLYPAADLHAMLGECDFVSVSAPLTPETDRMFDTAAFDAMKDGAFFANVARGEVVDENALKQALRSGKLAGVDLDVYAQERERPPDPELMALPGVVMTPHNSGITDDPNQWPMVNTFAANLRRLLANEPLTNLVDYARGY